MAVIYPETALELAEVLRRSALHLRTISLNGNGSKRLMAGPDGPADECISTANLKRVLAYDPRDLTISVEAGMPWRDLTCVLAEHRQMAALDPPFAEEATVGGVVASNTSGPRRRLYGSPRDVVIGMEFATVEGKVVRSGGMVVKNVAGLDMAKLLIGSFGTLAAITVVNFRLTPMPELERSFVLRFDSGAAALEARDRVLAGGLQPAAIDLLNPGAAEWAGIEAWVLAIRAGGNRAAMDRYQKELAGVARAEILERGEQENFWHTVENFTPHFLDSCADGAVVRVSCTLKGLESVMTSFGGPAVARAGSGVCYGYFEYAPDAAAWMSEAAARGWKAVIEFAPEERKPDLDLWPAPGGDLELMRRVKKLFDPDHVLNRGRLYNRI